MTGRTYNAPTYRFTLSDRLGCGDYIFKTQAEYSSAASHCVSRPALPNSSVAAAAVRSQDDNLRVKRTRHRRRRCERGRGKPRSRATDIYVV